MRGTRGEEKGNETKSVDLDLAHGERERGERGFRRRERGGQKRVENEFCDMFESNRFCYNVPCKMKAIGFVMMSPVNWKQ